MTEPEALPTDRAARLALANDDATPGRVLDQLARSGYDIQLLEAVASRRHCPPETLRFLADCDDDKVVVTVAGHAFTPHDVLRRLADEGDDLVLHSLAGNPGAPLDLLERLARDDSDSFLSLRESMAMNRSAPAWALIDIAKNGSRDSGRSLALRWDSLPAEAQQALTDRGLERAEQPPATFDQLTWHPDDEHS